MKNSHRDESRIVSFPGRDRTEELLEIMRERVLVLDGATGTMLQGRNLVPKDSATSTTAATSCWSRPGRM
jgi:methionine synthase I (cobalamin-dependent)